MSETCEKCGKTLHEFQCPWCEIIALRKRVVAWSEDAARLAAAIRVHNRARPEHHALRDALAAHEGLKEQK